MILVRIFGSYVVGMSLAVAVFVVRRIIVFMYGIREDYCDHV
jgi:hypothetical protein